MQHISFDREKYLTLLRNEGAPAALTALHKDIEFWEYQTFEGTKGWQPQMWEELKAVREFSRQIWDYAMAHPEKSG